MKLTEMKVQVLDGDEIIFTGTAQELIEINENDNELIANLVIMSENNDCKFFKIGGGAAPEFIIERI